MKAAAMSPRSIQNILAQDAARLITALKLDSSSARIEVQALLQHVLKVSRAYLLAYPERRLNENEQSQFDELFQRRMKGEPIAYILGEREFFGLMFKVTPATLIPRPETELLVELALQCIPKSHSSHLLSVELTSQTVGCGELASRIDRERCVSSFTASYGGAAQCNQFSAGHDRFRILDLGTGSGAIALSLAHARPDIEVVAVDASAEALEVARENVQLLGIKSATLIQSDWYASLANQRFELIVSNPPYIVAGDPHLQQGDLRFEPTTALASGYDGLDDIRSIVAEAPNYLEPGGKLLLEHGYDQATQVRELMSEAGFREVFSACDLAGIERVSGGCF